MKYVEITNSIRAQKFIKHYKIGAEETLTSKTSKVILVSFFIMSIKKMPGILIGTCILYICALRAEAGNLKCTGPGIGKVYDIRILGITEDWFNETATSKLQCDNYSVAVCLPVQYTSLLAVGCAENLCVNGNERGVWVLLEDGKYAASHNNSNECPRCPSHYRLVDSKNVILLSFFIMSTKKMPGILIGTCILYICALREEAGNIKCTGPGTGKVYDIQILGITEAWFNETATSKLQCDHYSVVVCLPVQYASLLAVGCAENSCVNGNERGVWVLLEDGKYAASHNNSNECPRCPSHYGLVDSKKCIDAGTTEEIFGSEAGAEEIDGNQFNCLESSYDQGTAKELEPPRLPESPFFPAKELKSLKGHSAQPDQENGKITLSSGHNAKSDLGKKLKITSHPEYRKCPQLVDVTNWIVAIILIIASKKKVLQLSICFRIIVSQTEGCLSEARVVDNITRLDPIATCYSHQEILVSCKDDLLLACLYSVPDNTLAWGCAPDICLNGLSAQDTNISLWVNISQGLTHGVIWKKGNVCPEWNKAPNGSYVVQGGYRYCSTCPSFYPLSQLLKERIPECYNSTQNYPTETTVTPATKNRQELSAGGIVGISLSVVVVIGAFVVGIFIWRERQMHMHSLPPTQYMEGEGTGMRSVI